MEQGLNSILLNHFQSRIRTGKAGRTDGNGFPLSRQAFHARRLHLLHGGAGGSGEGAFIHTLPITAKVIDMKHIQMITMMCVICVTASCTTQKVAYRERFEEAKGYALYACIAHMNKFVDSTSVINKDYSGEYFVQLSRLSLEEIIRIKEYVDKECMKYWSISHNPEGNMIAYSSWKFYNSKDLDNFIRKTLRKKYR